MAQALKAYPSFDSAPMIATVLAVATILGSSPLSATDPGRPALMFRSYGAVVVRLDAAGFVQARACDGRMRQVGVIPAQPVKVHISDDGALTGLVWDPTLTPVQRAAFTRMMLAIGYSDWKVLERACLPAAEAPAPDEPAPAPGRREPSLTLSLRPAGR